MENRSMCGHSVAQKQQNIMFEPKVLHVTEHVKLKNQTLVESSSLILLADVKYSRKALGLC